MAFQVLRAAEAGLRHVLPALRPPHTLQTPCIVSYLQRFGTVHIPQHHAFRGVWSAAQDLHEADVEESFSTLNTYLREGTPIKGPRAAGSVKKAVCPRYNTLLSLLHLSGWPQIGFIP